MYYTNQNEWIDFLGLTALVGICKAKLPVTDSIQHVVFPGISSYAERGTVIATFQTTRGSFDVYMPVDGKIVGINPKLQNNPSLILSQEPRSMWILKISPSAPYLREGLLREHQSHLQQQITGMVYG